MTKMRHIIVCQFSALCVNSLGPSDAIWCWRSWSTLVQVMACCLTAPSHYLNRCWFIICKVLWYSSDDIIIKKIWRYQSVKQDWRQRHVPVCFQVKSGTLVAWILTVMMRYPIQCVTPGSAAARGGTTSVTTAHTASNVSMVPRYGTYRQISKIRRA